MVKINNVTGQENIEHNGPQLPYFVYFVHTFSM